MYVDQSVPNIKDLEKLFSVESGGMIEKGGWWKPKTCAPRAKVEIFNVYRLI